jgi:hypothetical protein
MIQVPSVVRLSALRCHCDRTYLRLQTLTSIPRPSNSLGLYSQTCRYVCEIKIKVSGHNKSGSQYPSRSRIPNAIESSLQTWAFYIPSR